MCLYCIFYSSCDKILDPPRKKMETFTYWKVQKNELTQWIKKDLNGTENKSSLFSAQMQREMHAFGKVWKGELVSKWGSGLGYTLG